MEEVVTAKYKIIGFVQAIDADGNSTGEFPIGSVQDLPLDFGAKCVEAGTAELVEDDASDEAGADDELGETGTTEETE